MAVLDDAFTLLTSLSNGLKEVYHDDFPEMYTRFGRRINRMSTPSKRDVSGDGITIQVENRLTHGTRFGRSFNGAWPAPRGFGADKYKVTLSEDPSTNDFSVIKSSGRVTYLDLNRLKGRGSDVVGDLCAKLIKEMMDDQQEAMAIHRMIRATAQCGTVDGTPTQNDNEVFADCSATPGASTGVRFVVDGASVAIFQPGREFDIYDASTGLKNGTLWINDYNPRDNSVGAYLLDSNGYLDTTLTVSSSILADNDLLYLKDEKDAGMISFAEWYASPTAGEDFFGRDRTTAGSRWLRPTVTGPSSSSTFTKTFLDDLAIAAGYAKESPDSVRMGLMSPEMHQTFRNEVGADTLLSYPTTEQKGALVAQYGFTGAIYQHPGLGKVVLESDALMVRDQIWFPRIGDWECLFGLPNKFDLLPGDNGYWYREQADEPGQGKGSTYRVDGIASAVDICTDPRGQLAIENLTA